MGRQAGREPEDTKRLVLAAAAEVIHLRGPSATLDDIARHAGISKGGVVYHFSSKDALLQALVESLLETFRAAVYEHLDADDDAPGRLVRAYVRAALQPDATDQHDRETLSVVAQLMTFPAIADHASADAQRWEAEFREDGLAEDVRVVVISAADGAAAAAAWGAPISGARRRRLRESLLAMTRKTSGNYTD